MIQREIDNAKAGRKAAIFIKINALIDEEIIRAFYLASQAGVKIDLLVRGVCCLRSRIPGVSDSVTVRSIVGRFLEHSRIYRFENAGNPEIYLASADWTARNFFRRVEICFPVDNPELCRRIDQVIATYWKDNVKAREQGLELTYFRRPMEGDPLNAQAALLASCLQQNGSQGRGVTSKVDRQLLGGRPPRRRRQAVVQIDKPRLRGGPQPSPM
jgi:polyphosphate kinase